MARRTHLPLLVLAALIALLSACGRTPTPQRDGATLTTAALALGTQLLGNDTATLDNLGEVVAISGDTLILGAPGHDHDPALSDDGAAYVFELGLAGWVESDELLAPVPADDAEFGSAVALDGDTVAIGAPGDGEVHVFERVAGAWLHQDTISSGVANDGYGRAVALDGDLLVVGARWDDDAGFNAGALYVYQVSAGIWIEQAKLIGGAGAGNELGYAVAVDGGRVVAGSVFGDTVRVFEDDGVSWNETAVLSGTALTAFGQSVAVEGDTILVGAPEDDTAAAQAGAAYAFTHDGVAWAQSAVLTAFGAQVDDQFGSAVALEGDLALVGALFEDTGGTNAGASYAFRLRNGNWHQLEKLYATGSVWLGAAAAMDGGWAILGAPRDPTVASNAGAAFPVDLAAVLPAPLCDGLPATIHPLDPGTGSVTPNAAGGFDIVGTAGDDVIVGSERDDLIAGTDGDDVICGLSGDDLLKGGRGADLIYGGQGDLDELDGGLGPDTLVDLNGNAGMRGGPGDDVLTVTIPLGWNGGAMTYSGLLAGYGDDTVTFDNGVAGLLVQMSGDELDSPPSPLEGAADVLVPSGMAIDPASMIIKFP